MYSLRPRLRHSDKWLLIHCTGSAKIDLMDKSYGLPDEKSISPFTNVGKFQYNIKARSLKST